MRSADTLLYILMNEFALAVEEGGSLCCFLLMLISRIRGEKIKRASFGKTQNFSKKIIKSPKKHLQRRETCAIIILGCERLGQIAASVLRKPRYALMREVAATALG